MSLLGNVKSLPGEKSSDYGRENKSRDQMPGMRQGNSRELSFEDALLWYWSSQTFGERIQMKTAHAISILALLIAIVALVFALRGPSHVSDDELQEKVDAILRERERDLVAEFTPNFQKMFAEMTDAPGAPGKDWNPTTIKELVSPLVKIIETMQE